MKVPLDRFSEVSTHTSIGSQRFPNTDFEFPLSRSTSKPIPASSSSQSTLPTPLDLPTTSMEVSLDFRLLLFSDLSLY